MTRVVTQLPLREIWDTSGPLPLQRRQPLSVGAIKDLLRAEALEFVVADIGQPLRWIPKESCFDFWKRSVQPHLAESQEFELDAFPDGLAYVASAWSAASGRTVVVLEAHH